MTGTLLCGAQVITMAADRPDVERLDILTNDNVITAIGEDLPTTGAEVVDLTGRIVIPGLVNAHLHTWQTALRTIGADWTMLEYLPRVHGELGPRYRPDDIYIGTLAGALSQINCGATTIGDWSHNNLTPEHTDAALAALQQSGARAVFLHGVPSRTPETPHPLAEVDRLLDAPPHPLVTIGMAISGPQMSAPQVATTDLRAAAERGIVASMHQSGGPPAPGWEAVSTAKLFTPLTNIVHGAGLTDDRVKQLVDAGATFTTTPENELGHGHGTPITATLLAHRGAPSLGSDTDTAVPGDVLTAARVALAHQRGIDHDKARQDTGVMCPTATVTSKQALAWATTEGARALGLADRTGRIEAGLQADLTVIDARQLNLWPAHDPIAAALHADLANIEAVMIAGTWRKRDHRLIDVDLDTIKTQLRHSGEKLLAAPQHGD
jgi:5-methylthioadenosine/S-adenosylhomocysteine deaminase